MECVATNKFVGVLGVDHRHTYCARLRRCNPHRSWRRRRRRRRRARLRRGLRTLLRTRLGGGLLVALFDSGDAVVQVELRARHGVGRSILEDDAHRGLKIADHSCTVAIPVNPGRDDLGATSELVVAVRIQRRKGPRVERGPRPRLRRPRLFGRRALGKIVSHPPATARRWRSGREI